MKNSEKLSFDQLDQEIEVLDPKESTATLGGMSIEDLDNIVNAMQANGINSITSSDLASQGLTFETLANSTSQFGVAVGNATVLINSTPTGITTTRPPINNAIVEDPRKNEIIWALNNPRVAIVIYNNSETAGQAAINFFSNDPDSLHNGVGDAFRHAYWSALNTKEGSALAGEYGLIHEDFPGNPADEMAMDIANNNYGIAFSKANPNMTSGQLANALYQAAITGKLTTLSGPE